jgi:hypothetical protein
MMICRVLCADIEIYREIEMHIDRNPIDPIFSPFGDGAF